MLFKGDIIRPFLSTLILLVPPTCKSASNELALDAVSVTLTRTAVNELAVAFQVGLTSNVAVLLAVSVSCIVTLAAGAVLPIPTLPLAATRMRSDVPV